MVICTQQAGFRVLQALVQHVPEGLLDAEGNARVGVSQLLVSQVTDAEQCLTVEAEETGCVQHSLGQTGADRGLR